MLVTELLALNMRRVLKSNGFRHRVLKLNGFHIGNDVIFIPYQTHFFLNRNRLIEKDCLFLSEYQHHKCWIESDDAFLTHFSSKTRNMFSI